MKQKLLLLLLGLLMTLPARLSAFEFTYEGVTLVYSVIDKEAKTCMVSGYKDFSGALVIPNVANDGTTDYSVTKIGDEAFYHCQGLTSVVIPESVTEIGMYAFVECSGLTSVVIPNSVNSIGYSPFYRCSGLIKSAYPNTLTNPFSKGICVAYNPEGAIFEDGWIWGPEKNEIRFVPYDLEGEYTIPESVTSIGGGSFYGCSGLTSVVIPNAVTSIGNKAFYGCSGLTSVVIGDRVESIGESTFNNCSALTSVVIPNSVQTIGKSAFSGCSGLTSLVFNAENCQWCGDYKSPAFPNALTTLIIGDKVTIIPNYSFLGCSGLTSVVIPNSVQTIGESAFEYCSGLKSVVIGNSVQTIGESAFFVCSDLTSVLIGNSVETIGNFAFKSCSGLTSVVIPNSVQTIGKSAFDNCRGLKSVVIGNSVRTIDWTAFATCSGLIKSAYPNTLNNPFIDGVAVAYNPEGAILEDGWIWGPEKNEIRFVPYSLEGEYSIPESVTSIGAYAFNGCSGLTSVMIGNSVQTIGNGAFTSCSGLISVVIGNSVQTIGNRAFTSCSGLTSVVIGNSVQTIGDRAFNDCSDLTKAEYSSLESLCKIEFKDKTSNPLVYAHNLYIDGKEVTEVVIPESVTEIGSYAFRECNGLTSVVIGNSVQTIGNSAFYGCSCLTSVVIPNSVTSIGNDAFCHCAGLTSVVIPNSVISIGDYSFYNCSGLTSVVIPNSITSIGKYAFDGCECLKKSAYPNTLNNPFSKGICVAYNPEGAILEDGWIWGPEKNEIRFVPYSFEGEYSIPESVTSIGAYAFNGCSGLTSVVIGNRVESIGESAFKGCSGLTSVVIGNLVESIGESAFNGCSGLTSVVIPESVTSIGNLAFSETGLLSLTFNAEECNYCGDEYVRVLPSSIENLVIGDKVKTIPDYIFKDLKKLTSVVIPNSVQTIGQDAFEYCSGLTSVVIGNSVQTIHWTSFATCSGLIKSAYPNTLKNPFVNTYGYEYGTAIAYNPESAIIEDGWIWGPNKEAIYFAPLTLVGDFSIPESVTSIGGNAFEGCSGLTSVTALSVSPAAMNDDSFKDLYDTVKLTVPDESANVYLATNWGLFKNIQNNSGLELGSFSDGVLEYRLNPTDMTAMVIGAKDNSKLQIPERFTDDTDTANPVRYYIKGIGYKAFDGKGVNSVEFNSKSQMEYIGDYAFANTKISSITLPETLKNIGEYAFYKASNLSEVKLNEGLALIGEAAFAETKISSITVPESVSTIGAYAFYNTNKLSEVEMKEGLENIGEAAFYAENERSVTRKSLYLPSTVKLVGMHAFRNFVCSQVNISDLSSWYNIDFGSYLANPLCGSSDGLYVDGKKLTSLKVPEDIKEIKPYSFYNCKSLKEVTFPEGLEKIGASSFENCYNVTEVTIPASVVEIGDRVFEQRKVTFADGILPISFGEGAFCNSNGLTELKWGRPLESLTLNIDNVTSLGIGNLITEIPDGRFKNLKKLKTLSLGSSIQTIGEEAFSGCTSLEEVILPPSVETIGASAFAGNSKLESIIMGHKVMTIGEKAFDGCKANTVSITAQTPPTAPNNTFSNYSGKLYVQGEKAKDAYYDAFTCWDRFDSYVMIDAEEIKLEGADKISGKAGDTFQLTATVWPENVTLPQIFWRSTNPEIATVDANGLVTLHVDLESLKTRAQGEGEIDGTCTIIAETLYNDGPVAQVTVDENGANSVESIKVGENGQIDFSQPYDVYNMNGFKVGETTEGLAKGIYIIRQGKAAVKTVISQSVR